MVEAVVQVSWVAWVGYEWVGVGVRVRVGVRVLREVELHEVLVMREVELN